jgi:CubicO group peptidase (beta-lactamase class C family)
MRIASLSKSFTALAVMQLAEAGDLRLDDPVVRHLPEFAMADPRAEQITIRQLLGHSSGMSDTTYPEAGLPQPDSLRQAAPSWPPHQAGDTNTTTPTTGSPPGWWKW